MASSTTETTTTIRTGDNTNLPEAGTYFIDPSHTTVGFSGRHLMVTKVRGRFAEVEGAIRIADDPTQSSVEVSLAAASVDTRNEQRDGHLKSADFLDVENYPTITFQSTGLGRQGRDGWKLIGNLTVKDVTHPVELDVDFEGTAADPWGGTRIAFAAKGELNREDWGITWNQALETGGVLVGKKATLELDVQAIRQ